MHVRVHVRAQGLDVEELSPVDQKRTHALLSYCLIKILQVRSEVHDDRLEGQAWRLDLDGALSQWNHVEDFFCNWQGGRIFVPASPHACWVVEKAPFEP